MTASASPLCPSCAPAALHARFLAILPRIERHGEVYFRHVKCPHQKEQLLAELRGLAWKGFVHRGQAVHQFVSALATWAARAVNHGPAPVP